MDRTRRLALSSLVCLGRHTVTGLMTSGGRQFEDWSADYRLFSERRFAPERIFGAVRENVLTGLPEQAPLVAAMDDTILRKTGGKTCGVSYRRDPLGPAFHTNFVRGQRFIQLSAAVPHGRGAGPARMIPIDFRHAPTPKKPKRNAGPDVWSDYRQAQSRMRLGRVGVQCVNDLRADMDHAHESRNRPLWMVVDGSFTNREVLKAMPERTTLIGRIRKDARLSHAPDAQPATGRRRFYGIDAPTPEEVRQDKAIPWETACVFAAGRVHRFKIKAIRNLRWRVAGGGKRLMLIVIAPLGYRPRKGSRLLYRQPAYLICTDDGLPVQEVLQAYVWRWDIEVNFRDEKTILGVGQAQVRNENSVETAPALSVAAYAMLLLAGIRAYGASGVPDLLPRPKWQGGRKAPRASTNNLINIMRHELWSKALNRSGFTHFASGDASCTNSYKQNPQLASAVLYAVK